MNRERPRAAVLLTGDELLDGRVRDTNGHYLSSSLVERGARVTGLLIVPDEQDLVRDGLRTLLHNGAEIVVVSGGLGTTHDDLTMASVADALGLPLEEDAEALAFVRRSAEAVARRRGLPLDEVMGQARRQALLPRGARCIHPAGMAPGALLELDGTVVVVLPGVPRELQAMWPPVLEEVSASWSTPDVLRILRLYGVGEMAVVPIIEPALTGDLDVAVTAGDGEITVRVAGWGREGTQHAYGLIEAIGRALPVFSDDGSTIDDLVIAALLDRHDTVSVAESCTGGLLGGRLTHRGGSSDYFQGGVISYANEVKASMLGVPQDMLARYGAVSEQVAIAMAEGVRNATGTTWGLSVTGVAGPGGGSPEKPVGLVFFGCAGPHGTAVREYHGFGDRESVRRQSVVGSLHLLWEELQKRPTQAADRG